MKHIEFIVERYKPGLIDPPRFQTYALQVPSDATVLDCLEQIRLTLDDTLVYRHSCHHSACGTCACIINGIERLACMTRVSALGNDTVTLSPLRGFARIADLSVDMTGFYRDIDPGWQTLRKSEPAAGPDHSRETSALRLEDCIECGACVSSCPAMHGNTGFMGPAALAALNNQKKKVAADQQSALMRISADPRGERLCERALNCSRVCPTKVYPARHIADLRNQRQGADQV